MRMLSNAQDDVLTRIKAGCFDDDHCDVSKSFVRSARCLEQLGILKITKFDKYGGAEYPVMNFEIVKHPPTTSLPSFHAWYRACFLWASKDLRSSIMGIFGFRSPVKEFQQYFEAGLSSKEAVNLFFKLNETH